jgi:leucyl aminopeptidase
MFKSVTAYAESHPDAVAIAAFANEEPNATHYPAVQQALRSYEWKGDAGQVVDAYPAEAPRTLILGLGDRKKLTPAVFRNACAALARRVATTRVPNLHIDFRHELEGFDYGVLCGEAFGLLSWTSAQFRGTVPDERPSLTLASLDGDFDKGIAHGLALAESANLARTIGNTPPNIATPSWIAIQARRLETVGLNVEVHEGDALERERMEGIRVVGRASANPPCFIRIEYRPENAENVKPVVLVGKTMTYDTGGLSLKPREGMVGMKGDKLGGCAVLGAMHAIATVVKPAFPVVALLSVAENSVNGDAYRPDDVMTFRNGVTVEVTNTDAEGRLVLADALCWAYEKENPACVIDFATLTGGIVIALGSVRAGLFCDSDALRSAIQHAGETTGEKVWPMPLDDEYKDMMKSPVADMVNSGAKRGGHPVQGAIFLKAFTKDSAPWAHVDIAGVANADDDKGMYTRGANGFGVRLLAELVAKWTPA